MSEQVYKEHARTTSSETDVVDAPPVNPEIAKRGEKIKSELDDLLDEIEEVLETNAVDFVKDYIQKGGQ